MRILENVWLGCYFLFFFVIHHICRFSKTKAHPIIVIQKKKKKIGKPNLSLAGCLLCFSYMCGNRQKEKKNPQKKNIHTNKKAATHKKKPKQRSNKFTCV